MARLLAVCLLALPAFGAEFHLVSGDIYKGELASASAEGIIIRQVEGGFSPRIDYAKLTEETLQMLLTDPRSKKFAEPFVEPPAEEIAIREAKQIAVRPPDRVERPQVKPGLMSALTTPNGLVLLGLLYLANLYAGIEVARFRQRPVALVCGLSAVLPIVGPIIFLALHKGGAHAHEGLEAAPAADAPQVAMQAASGESRVSNLGIVKGGHGTGSAVEGLPKVFKRGETTFNRRFFETQFPSFFRMVNSEADKDLVLDISAGKSSCTAVRISRISANEIHFKTTSGGEVGTEFGLVSQVTLRHKDQRT
jgi:hypothetical protein